MKRKPADSNSEPKRKVRVQRRRRSERTSTEGRERAEAPRRTRSDPGDAAPPPSTRTGESAAGGQIPVGNLIAPVVGQLLSGRRISPLVIVLLILLVICVVCAIVFVLPQGMGDFGDLGGMTYSTPESFQTEAPLETAEPFVPPTTSATGQTWLVMLYQDADDKILEQDIYVDLNEAERIGSGDRVHIVTQVDRYQGGYRGDADWVSAKRFYVTQDDDLQRVRSQLVADLGEVNMSDADTLVDFATWAIETLPADKHVLILSDHGMGWPGGWSDPAPGGKGDPSIPLSSALGDQLYLMEIDAALEEIRAQTGLEQFELIGMDACLMGHLEVLTALTPHARYAVTSQETEPALGWAYAEFLGALKDNPDMNGAELGRLIVESYIQDDQRIVDDQARAELLRQGSPMGGLFSPFGQVTADQLAQQMAQNITLAAVSLQALPELLDSVNDLSFALQGEEQVIAARARSYAQSFTSVFGRTVPPSYIDLGHFTQLVRQESRNAGVIQAADRVLASLDRLVIAERHGPNKPGATGVSIYFPNSQLYQSPAAGPQSYTAIAHRFAEVSLWDEFLAYHYTGRPFELSTGAVVIPEAGASVSGPGAGRIEVSPITRSDSVAAPGQPVLLSADISGDRIGYVYLFVGFYDQASNAIFVADSDYLESTDTREIDGVYYPGWGEGDFTMEFEWEPIVFAIDDGVDSVVAYFTPESYGVSFEQAIYSVDGIYTYADGGESRYARLYFSDGALRQVFGFTGQEGTGAPREIIPQTGDTFTVLEKWMDLDASGNIAQVSAQEGGTLTFRDRMFTWEELDAPRGAYIVGFIVEDLDGNQYAEYTQVTVE
jgi:hypothetical protein